VDNSRYPEATWNQSRSVLYSLLLREASYVERFNRTYRTEVFDAYLFTSMHEIRTVTEAFQHKYNHFRPHGSLNDMAPVEFKEHRKSLTGSTPSKGFKAVASKGENP
jgi:hypothetical protein